MKERVLNSFVARVVKRYAAASGGTWAIDIAWNTLFAFFPIILAITIILGLFTVGSSISGTLDRDIANALPGQQGALLVDALHSFRGAAGPLAVLSFLGLLWSGSSLFSAMDQGLDALYPTRQRSFIRQKVMAVSMIGVFTVLVVLDVASAALASLVTTLHNAPAFLSSGAVALLLQIAFGVIDGILLFGAIYRIVPNRPNRVREILPGAITAAVLFEAFTLLFPLYFKLQHGFSTYGSTFALFFLLMTFAFWLGQIIMLCGAVNAERHPPAVGAWPRAGSSISPDAQAEADRQQREAAPAEHQEILATRQRQRSTEKSRPKVRGDGWSPEAARWSLEDAATDEQHAGTNTRR